MPRKRPQETKQQPPTGRQVDEMAHEPLRGEQERANQRVFPQPLKSCPCYKAHEFNILRGVSPSRIEANLDASALTPGGGWVFRSSAKRQPQVPFDSAQGRLSAPSPRRPALRVAQDD